MPLERCVFYKLLSGVNEFQGIKYNSKRITEVLSREAHFEQMELQVSVPSHGFLAGNTYIHTGSIIHPV